MYLETPVLPQKAPEEQENKRKQQQTSRRDAESRETHRKNPQKLNVDTSKNRKVGSLTLERSMTAASNGLKGWKKQRNCWNQSRHQIDHKAGKQNS
jgi:hypothetical protein